MFTGIIQETALVESVDAKRGGLTFSVAKPERWRVQIGESISVNGVCSTVTHASSSLVFAYMPETIRKTNLGSLRVEDVVNVEQSLRASQRLDGHIVLGHVDTVGTIARITNEGNSSVFAIRVNQGARGKMGLIAEKGSIAVEGISLTVVSVGSNVFTVHVIPYTLAHTNLGKKKRGDAVNIEIDILAKYVQSILCRKQKD